MFKKIQVTTSGVIQLKEQFNGIKETLSFGYRLIQAASIASSRKGKDCLTRGRMQDEKIS
jgi:hypothetical protein